MNDSQFDDLTRALATGVSRRRALQLIAGALFGTALSELVPGRVLASGCSPPCSANQICCTAPPSPPQISSCCPTDTGCFVCDLNLGCISKCTTPPLVTCCNNACIDVQTDPNNCGFCGHSCASGQTCVSGICCSPGQTTICAGICTNLQTDPNNCGACANFCVERICVNGKCGCTSDSQCPSNAPFCCNLPGTQLRGCQVNSCGCTSDSQCPSGQKCCKDGTCKTTCMTVRFVALPPSEVQPTVFLRTGYNLSARVNVVPLRLTVIVEENGQPTTQSVTVHVDDTSQNDGSGHGPGGHAGVRPHGWLLQTTDPQPTPTKIVAQSAIGGSQDTTGLDVHTNAGQATFVWLPPEIAGTDTIRVSIVGHPEVTPAVANINVRIDGFVNMPADPQHYALIGANSLHPSNHSATSATVARLQAAAQNYINNQQNDSQLQQILTQLTNAGYGFPTGTFPAGKLDLMQINDISLPEGGLFDVNGNWTTPHGGHRWGNMADFRTNYMVGNPQNPQNTALGDPNAPLPISNLVRQAHLKMFLSLKAALTAAGGQILFEANHLHVVFPT